MSCVCVVGLAEEATGRVQRFLLHMEKQSVSPQTRRRIHSGVILALYIAF